MPFRRRFSSLPKFLRGFRKVLVLEIFMAAYSEACCRYSMGKIDCGRIVIYWVILCNDRVVAYQLRFNCLQK